MIGNYWTAVIYYKARNGTYHRVPQRAQQGIEKTNGGMVLDPLFFIATVLLQLLSLPFLL